MKKLLTILTAVFVLSISGAAMAAEKGSEGAVEASMATTVLTAGDISVTKQMNADGDAVLTISKADLARLLELVERTQKPVDNRARIEAAFENIYSDW